MSGHLDDVCAVKQTAGTGSFHGSSIYYQDVYMGNGDNLRDPGPNPSNVSPTRTMRGLELVSLPSGSIVRTGLMDGSVKISDSSAATILVDEWLDGTFMLDGTQAHRNGYSGIVYGASAGQRNDIVIHDNLNLTVGYFYVESTQRILRAEGNGAATAGHVTVSGARLQPFDPEIASIHGYAGRVSFLSSHSDYYPPNPYFPINRPPINYTDVNGNVSHPALECPISQDVDCDSSLADTFCIKGTSPLKFSLIGNNYTDPGLANVVAPETTQVTLLHNGIWDNITTDRLIPDTNQAQDLTVVAEALNDMRQLRNLDLLLNGPAYQAGITHLYLDASNKAIGNLTGTTLQVFDSSNRLVKTLTDLTVNPNGEIVLDQTNQLSGLNDTATYTILVKVPNFLIKKLAGVTNLFTQPVIMPANLPLAIGDASNRDQIGISNLVTFIRLFNAQVDSADITLYRTLNGNLGLNDLADLIRQFNVQPHGDVI